jgi:DNA repair protein RadC
LNILGTGLILIHNHPSGNPNPSDADKAITKKIKEAGLLMEMAVPDHIIIGNTGYYSFADEGQI